MVVTEDDACEMNQAVSGEETRPGDGGRPIVHAPCARRERESCDQKRRTDIRDKVCVERAGFSSSGHGDVPKRAA